MKSFFASLAALTVFGTSLPAQTLSNYQYTVLSQGPGTYFQLDSSLASAVDPGVILDSFGGGYASDVYRNPTNTRYFVNGTDFLRNTSTNLINGGGETNTLSTAAGSITLLFRSLDSTNTTGQRYLFYAGNSTAEGNALSLFFENTNYVANADPSSLKLRFGNTTTTILQATNLLPSTWYYFAVTYLESRVPNKAIWYLGPAGGVLASGMTTNADYAVAGDGGGILYIGNQTNLTSAYRSPGNGRIDEFAIWNRELSAAEITNQFARLPQLPPATATYAEVVTAQLPTYFFQLNASLTNSVSPAFSLLTNAATGAFTNDLLGNPFWAYCFNETNDAIFTTNDIINGGGFVADSAAAGVGSVSLLFRMLSDTNNTGQRYLLSQGGVSGTQNQFALFLENTNTSNGDPNSLKLRMGNGPTTTIRQPADLTPNAWYYFAMTYDESRNSNPGEVKWYLGPVGGVLTNGAVDIANTAVIGDNGWFVIGNRTVTNAIQNNAYRGPGSGVIDEVAIWREELSPSEITAQFNAATNTPAVVGPAPTLNILLSGSSVVLSWPSTTSPGYVLEATNVLDSTTIGQTNWPSAGAATVVGTNFVVTNTLAPGNSFYRLHKP
jgi:hypothetical protein